MIYVPTKLDDISHIVIQYFLLFQCWDPLCGYGCSPQAGTGTQAKAQPYHSQHSYVGFSLYCWGSELVCLACRPGPLYCIHTTNLYFSVNQSFTDRNCFPEIPLKTQSAQNKHALSLAHGSSLGKGTLRQFLESQWPATQIIVTLVWHNPDPTCLATPNNGKMHLFNRPNTQPIRFHTLMTTLHTSAIPPRGMHQVLCRKDRYQFYSPVVTNKSFVPIPASLFLPFSILLLSYSIFNKLAVTPGNQSLDAKPQHAMTMYKPYNNSLVGNKTRHNKRWLKWCLYAVRMKVKIWHYFYLALHPRCKHACKWSPPSSFFPIFLIEVRCMKDSFSLSFRPSAIWMDMGSIFSNFCLLWLVKR